MPERRRPLPAHDGGALRIAQFRETPVDLMVTDVVMPVMSGVDLARTRTKRWPNLRVLYLSGYPEAYVARARALESGALSLPKPFTPVQLAAAVRRALDAGRVSGTA